MVQYRQAALSRQHFLNMFPHASSDDLATLTRISHIVTPTLSRLELRAAGQFFTRFLCPDHEEAKQRMRRRWRRLCRYGCVPGTAKADIFSETLAQFCR
jgi:hypothetical protein